MSWDNYTYKKQEHTERQPGNYRCIILKAEAGVSKTSGKNMLTMRGTATTQNSPSTMRSTRAAYSVHPVPIRQM